MSLAFLPEATPEALRRASRTYLRRPQRPRPCFFAEYDGEAARALAEAVAEN